LGREGEGRLKNYKKGQCDDKVSSYHFEDGIEIKVTISRKGEVVLVFLFELTEVKV